MSDLSISSAYGGATLTVMALMYALFQYPGGRFADKLTRKTILMVGSGLVICGLLLVTGAIFFPILVLGAGVIGAGAGLYYISMRAATADLYVKRRAQSFGIQGAIGRVGSASAAGVAVLFLTFTSWRTAFLPVAIGLAIMAVLVHYNSEEGYVFESVQIGIGDTALRLLGNRLVRRTLLSYVLMMFVLQGVIGFMPTYLQFERGFSSLFANAGYAAIYVIGIGVAPLSGYLADRYKKLPISFAGLLLAITGLIGLIGLDGTLFVGLSFVLFGFGMFAFPPATQAYLVDIFHDESFAGDLGASKTVYGGVGSIGPTYVGVVANEWNYTIAYLGLVVVLAAAMLMVLVTLVNEPS